MRFWVFCALCFSSASVFAEQVMCQGHLRNKNIPANLIVTQKCILDHVKIDGNIHIQHNGSLTLKRSQILGNIQADDYFSGLHIEESHVTGDIQIRAGREVHLQRNHVTGKIDIQNNIGNIVLKHNQSQTLICIHNRIMPRGTDNQAPHKTEQCSNL